MTQSSALSAFERALDRLKAFYEKGGSTWSERDAKHELGSLLREELAHAGLALAVHYEVPISTEWWKPNEYHMVAKSIKEFQAKLEGKAKIIDLVLHDDLNKIDRLPIFPVAVEVKHTQFYRVTTGNKGFVRQVQQDKVKLRLLKECGLAEEVCFVLLDQTARFDEILQEDWGPVMVYQIRLDTTKTESSTTESTMS